jgi:DNA-binding CsgD family transcriptional regulator
VAIGEPVGLRELTRIVDLDGVVAAEAAGIIKIEQEQRRAVARCVHSMHAQLFRAQLGTARMLKTLREIDGVLAHTPSRRQSDTVKRALIRLEMGDAQPGDASILAEASKQARPDYVLAERLARAALDQGGGFTALDHLIDALFWQGRVEEATEAAAMVGEFASAEELEYFKARWSRMLWWITGERQGDALSTPGGEVGPGNDPLTWTRDDNPANAGKLGALARQAAMEAAGGRAPGALPMALSLLAEPLLEDEGQCWAAGAAIIGLGGQGKVSEALALMDGARASARRLQDYNYQLLLAVIEVRVRRLAGDLAGARDAVGDIRGVLAGAPDANAGIVALIEAEIILATGSALDAVVHVRDAAAILDQLDFGGLSATAHLRLAESLALTGDTIGAADQLVLAAATEDRVLELFRPEQLLSKAWTHFAVGSMRLGLDALSEARSMAQTQGEGLVELHVHHSGLRLGDRGAAREVLKLACGIEGPFAAAAGQHAKAWLDSDTDGLVAAAEQFAAMGALGHAADAIAQAARQAQQSGESDTSFQLAVRGADIAADLGGLNTPALRSASPRASLTRRQRDVAGLAAEGLSSREIAERLGVGVRTIESHLDAAYRRLGVSSRAELTALLRPV